MEVRGRQAMATRGVSGFASPFLSPPDGSSILGHAFTGINNVYTLNSSSFNNALQTYGVSPLDSEYAKMMSVDCY